MAAVPDVIAYLRKAHPALSGKKLQKLLFYGDVWALVWDGAPLFRKEFEAWVEGPVLREAYALEQRKQGKAGSPGSLKPSERATLDAVVAFYGKRSGDWLSHLTHLEPPWRRARRGLKATASSKAPIRRADVLQFYGATQWGQGKSFSRAYERGLELLVEMPADEVDLLAAEPLERSLDVLGQMETGDEP